ncbi:MULTISPECIES: DNA repair protein RecN [Mediterraneibacter]|uniref:DNA repair protein RecN n=1 Tax=Mediterraneibacter TaxID=2316020 RepID=UPI0022E18E2F|nr:DNA repair protein RecN [Mediterraneibacter massiliensis]
MLQNLYVKNLALIDEAEVTFQPGLNILTGETGAGKSILLGSVNLALGGRYSGDILRNGAKAGVVELTFSVEDENLQEQLEAYDVFPEEGMLTLSRKLMEGRSVSRVNGETVSKNVLKNVASLLIDIHGQHEHQTLLNKKNHLVLLDMYAKEETDGLKKKAEQAFRDYKICRKKLEESSLNEEERRKEMSLAQFEVSEIEEASLREGEDEELETLYRRMVKSRKLKEGITEAYQYTSADEVNNASTLLSRAIRALSEAADCDEKGGQLYEQILEIDSLLNDFNRELSDYAKSFDFSEEEFYETETRLNLLNHLKSKYGSTIQEILTYYDGKVQRLKELEDYDAYILKLEQQAEESEIKLKKICECLHTVREKAAKGFAQEIKKQLADLNFMDNQFEIRISDLGHYTESGRDDAEIYIAVNPGEALRPLSLVASGGELSRIMLAVKTVLADEEDTPTLIFDEIDTGISGITAGKVAEKMQVIGKNRQVICITHLPQIAAAADSHFLIEKTAESGKTRTQIRALDKEESIRELARILGGANVTDSILDSAKELKELAASERKYQCEK